MAACCGGSPKFQSPSLSMKTALRFFRFLRVRVRFRALATSVPSEIPVSALVALIPKSCTCTIALPSSAFQKLVLICSANHSSRVITSCCPSFTSRVVMLEEISFRITTSGWSSIWVTLMNSGRHSVNRIIAMITTRRVSSAATPLPPRRCQLLQLTQTVTPITNRQKGSTHPEVSSV